MPELLITADGELATITELSTQLPTHGKDLTDTAGTITTKIPTTEPKPAEFIRIITVGGARRDLVTDTHTLALEGYATDEQAALDLTALAAAVIERAARRGLLGGRVCYSASCTVPGNLPHPSVPTHFRYTSTVSLELRRHSH